MTIFGGRNWARYAAMVVAGLNAALALVAGLVFGVYRPPDFFPVGIPWVFSSIVIGLLAVLILYRHPGHVIGWLFVLISFLGTFVILGSSWFTTDTPFGLESETALFSFIGELIWIVSLFAPLTLVLMFFPDGRLPSRFWWPLPLVTVMAMIFMAAGFVFAETMKEEFLQLLDILTTIFFLLVIFGSLAAVVVRFRRSHDTERLQMKWLVYTAFVGILGMFLLILILEDDSPVIGLYTTSLPGLLALSMGVAILRYRLYDIDIIIRRTLQYGIVTATLALVYFGLVVIFQALFATLSDQQSGFYIAASTLVIAALFNPVRKRVQAMVDRRFYRRKYRAE